MAGSFLPLSTSPYPTTIPSSTDTCSVPLASTLWSSVCLDLSVRGAGSGFGSQDAFCLQCSPAPSSGHSRIACLQPLPGSVPCDLLQPMKSAWKPQFQLGLQTPLYASPHPLLFPATTTNSVSLLSEDVRKQPSASEPCHTWPPETNLWEGKRKPWRLFRLEQRDLAHPDPPPFPLLSSLCSLETTQGTHQPSDPVSRLTRGKYNRLRVLKSSGQRS